MLSNLRSLLLAAIVLSHCITWTASRHHYSHNVAGHRSRHRRQGAGLYLSASYVIPGGEGAGWGEWGEVSPCSRTCGGGVASQKRICLQMGPDDRPACTGGDTKYFSCQTQDCPDSEDFRAQQCAEYNDVSFRGIRYKWVPYTRAPNPCELNCMPHGERFYYRQKTAVVDGTRCNDESFDVCVNGTCQPVGCDMMLGSSAKEDKCRQCRGNGANCHTLSGLLDTQDLFKGYNDILLLPEGATTIIISEIRASNNYLALRAKNGTYYLNGDYHIDFPRSIVIAGAIWYYERSQQGFPAPDKLRCSGPINEPLYLSLLLQDDNVGIEYEYSLPKTLAPRPTQQYNWVHEEFTPCSVSCGGGTQIRNVSCRSREELNVVDDSLCDEGLKPPTSQACSTQACSPQWVASPWGECSKKCGKGGTKSREVHCEKVITNGFPSIVADKECFDLLGAKPELYQECNVDAPCPTWFVGSWKPCDKLCDEGKQRRQVVCYQKDENNRKTILDDEDCEEEKPESEQSCMLEPCVGVDWVLSDWEGCDNCLSVNRTRIAECATKEQEVVDDKFCAYHPQPVLSEPCDAEKLPPCEVQWYATQWSKCSVDCGEGVQTRKVFCGRFDGESVMKVEDELCKDQPKYKTSKPCTVPKEKCPSKWYAGPWSECTKECGRGEQYRRVMCLKGSISATDCDINLILDSTQSCNPGPCNKDEVIPVDSSLTPVMDGEVDCEEDYPEVGLDEDSSDIIDLMFSDSPSSTGEGSGFTEHDFDDLATALTTDTGSGSDLTDEYISVSSSSSTDFEGSGETDITTVTESPESTTDADYTDSVEPEIKKVNISETKWTKITEITVDETEETSETESTSTEATESTISTVKDGTGSTESTVSGLTDDTTDTAETSTIVSTITEESSTTKTIESTVTVETDSAETTISSGSTDSTITNETEITDVPTSSGSTESTITDETKETLLTNLTESTITVESSSPASIEPTITEKMLSGSTEFTLTEETSTTGFSESIITEETKETSQLESTESTITEKSTTSESTQSEITEESKETSPIGLTESTLTEETISSGFTESTLSEKISSLSSTDSTITEETKETAGSTESTLTEVTSSSESTESTIAEETKETSPISSTEPTVTEETSSFGSTYSTILEETKETSLISSTESTLTEETSPSVATESTLLEKISTSISTETTITKASEETPLESSTESAVPEEYSTSSSKESITTEETSSSSSTEPTVTKATESLASESTSTSETEETTIMDKTVSVVPTELEETTTQKSTVSEETTKTDFISTTDIVTPEPAVDEKTTRTKHPEETISIEGSTTTESLEQTASTESGSTESESLTTISTLSETTTESIITETGTTEPIKTTEVSVTETEETEGSTTETVPPTATESSTTTESESTGTVTLTMEVSSGISTDSTVMESSSSESTGTAESTTTGTTEEPESTSAGTTESSISTTEEPLSKGTTIWDYRTTLRVGVKGKCRPRKTTCAKSKFGCCPDMKTAAAGPFDEGCQKSRTCKESRYGCCPDGVSPAQGLENEGCPTEPCVDTLFGCCLSDNKTAAEGNDQEGCPPPACKSTEFGCCEDEETNATGPDREGCPEKTTTEVTTVSSSTELELTQSSSELSTLDTTDVTVVIVESCLDTEFGCCSDNETIAEGPNGQGCPCNTTVFGCCRDGVSTALGVNYVGCPSACVSSRYGCCQDNETPAHGPEQEGCCLLTAFGCCPDNRKPADGPHLEGCGCQYAQFGCCPDNVTYAHGPNNKDCGCQYTEHGCCPDRHTEATGPSFEGCPCHTYQFGCCPDGVTVAKGPGQQGCHCEKTTFGCCGDGQTAAAGPEQLGCDCSSSKFGCCPDGVTAATGDKFLGCTDAPENKQAACSLPTDRGSCLNYSVYWFYDVEYGGCSRFWYGGCDGNGNRFSTKEECEDICVQPPPKDACKLPKSKGACLGYHVMWHYDSESEQCRQFVYGGCLGNANKFETRQQCQAQCEPTRTADQCTLPIERGSCAGTFPRWAFNPETHKCEEFIWGGCEGNPNRFGSEAACIQRCDAPGVPKPQCEQPQDVGSCTEKQALWSFSQTENRCVPFYYSGCGGNENKFDSEERCAEVCPSAYVPDICTLPAETGECANYREKWYFDTTQQRCRQFYYGGCGGNNNNFETRAECEGRCTEQVTTTTSTTVRVPEQQNVSEYCFMEMDAGPCNQIETRWAYDYTVGRCTTFQYGGCGGNGNNFPTQEHCQYYCTPTQDLCQLPMLSGPCEQSLMRWFYDPSSDSCSQFTYGGCEGNDNRFDTREDCERRCRTGPAPTAAPETMTTTMAAVDSRPGGNDLPPECSIAPILERCERAGEVWYMDTQRRECVPFENNESGVECMNTGVFASQEYCERSCGVFRNIDVCRYDVDPGPCQTYQSKYYFNATAGRCMEFAYGGCHGGPNRFSTIDECMDICRPEIDPCKLGPEPGNCLARFIQWYYIPERDECNQFIYTGCGGNDNRFESRDDCERRCRRPLLTTTTTTTTTARPITTHSPVSEECRTPPSLAPCGDAIAAYYYNSETSTCEVGPIGGCGYQNTYRSEEECERRCGAFKDIDVCRTYLDPGSCQMSIPKFYWDAASGSCLPYTYSGCGGNPNRFSTAEECQELCGPTGPAPRCLEEGGVVGTPGCGSPSRRWYYSVSRADCIVFAYQSCGGNRNNFITYEECASLCKVLQSPDTNEVLPDCSVYTEHCSRAASECPFGVEMRVEDGCQRCNCKPVTCERFEQECDALLCAFGVLRVAGEDGCPRCTCNENPCNTANCSSSETCQIGQYRDPTTQEIRYSARCDPEVNNEILPECDRYNEECASLNCPYSVQRTRTASGCERCSCVPVEVDCTSFREECDTIQCSFGIDRTKDDNGCFRCACTDPCKNKVCSIGERCVIITYRDPISTQIKNSTECRTVNKVGYCPEDEPSLAEGGCRTECNDDADCRGMAKCCQRGCFSLCLLPVTKTTTLSTTTTTVPPELPHPPAPNTELTEPEVTVAEGGKATLRCLFHGNPPPKITWRRNEITIDGDVGRYRLLSDGALEIVSLYRNDSGVYICIADNGLGTAMQEIRLQVSDPVKAPAGIAGDENAVITGDLGRPLNIRCLTYGYPKPTVYWYRGATGPMVPFSSAQYEARFDVLRIRKLTYDTLGEYLCQAYNGQGKPASWLVVVRAYQPQENREDNKYLVTRGDKVVDLTSREPRTEISTTTTTPAPLLEPQPEPEPDYDTPIIYTVPVSTNISNTALNLTVGRELTVTCDVNGYPEPDVYWTKDSVRLVHNERIWISGTSISRLTIPHVATSDSGVYACHAVNAYGSHYSTLQVIVQAPSIPAKCVDNPYFANCTLIVRNRFCNHIYYSRFCCKSCMEAGQLSPEQAEMQSDQPYAKRK